ncbi:MAG: hypothetical protein IJJ26_03160, partial [Victivallales bacterium]|nr:hypothetical protein [Victivallales bacterium]
LQGFQECNTALPDAFLNAYAQASNWSPKRALDETRRVLDAARARWQLHADQKKAKLLTQRPER